MYNLIWTRYSYSEAMNWYFIFRETNNNSGYFHHYFLFFSIVLTFKRIKFYWGHVQKTKRIIFKIFEEEFNNMLEFEMIISESVINSIESISILLSIIDKFLCILNCIA